jgi:four helix bundle protein
MAVVKRKRRHHELLAWQRAVDLVEAAYAATHVFPKHELYGLTGQIRRAAISVASNIAEGAARSSKKEFLHFLGMARGSLSELETQFIIAEKLKYLDAESEIHMRLDEAFGLLGGLMNSLRKSIRAQEEP